MQVFESVKTVLAIRSYQDKPIPNEVVERIVEAAHLTASSMNKQPWHFIVVEDRQMLKKIGALASHGPYIAQAAMAVVVAIEDTRFSISDASRAIQSMVLTAWEQGVGSNWVGFYGMEPVKALLGIPENLDVLAIIPFGYPDYEVGKGIKKRKPLKEIASRERFGYPFA